MKTIYSIAEELKSGGQLFMINQGEIVGILCQEENKINLDTNSNVHVELFFFQEDYPNLSFIMETKNYACKVSYEEKEELYKVEMMKKNHEKWESITDLTSYSMNMVEGLLDLDNEFPRMVEKEKILKK